MKKLKGILSLILAALMAFCVSSAALAADGVVLSGDAGENVSWTLTSDGVLTVSGVGPVLDDTEEEMDDDGVICITTYDSIGRTVDRYLSELTEGMNAADAARVKLDLVQEIVVEEGITEIPQDEFFGMYPARVTLPASLEELGCGAFDLLFAEELVVNSVKL